ncbi:MULTISPECIES: PLP-dependent aminotransferase family protein [Gordonia]|uniref:aminotransferase-like domain-containing protein n=1 Tax=Gordonia TaxID=2053 RepID=UPI00095E6C92|nr:MULTISPECIES: PLP-dependent aminotransferase family protein [Gordonia]MDH3005843.1 PLP-dependent aminotransferase family protein [Gordonia alkanivorans]MDH3016136.1 PLP-dependent aminotransferase family protein [Gordonia alkanivorans]MDH3040976.1 PLP-dependent aminotransferase family protein [Gordonia alkanivorans]OLT52567.1 hypothetical protein BJF87_13655 [Gordonia sp. CNJ-863]
MTLDELIRDGAADRRVIMLGGGMPAAELFPREALATAFRAAMDEPKVSALQYDWPEGQVGLREWVARRLRSRGADVSADDVILTAGAQQGISLASHFLVPAGARVRVAAESYPAALELFRHRGARLVLQGEDADCVYWMDGIDNPRGSVPDEGMRNAILREGLPLIVDEAYAELDFTGDILRPLLADARDRVWHIGSVSKTLAPGLRTGWVVPPPSIVDRVVRRKFSTDLQSSTLSQILVERILESVDYEAHLVRARSIYEQRARVMSSALRHLLPDWHFSEPAGGFAIFAETAHRGSHPSKDEQWLRAATAEGVVFDPGSLFQVRPEPHTLTMRLCFSAMDGRTLYEGVERLKAAWLAYRGASERAGANHL